MSTDKKLIIAAVAVLVLIGVTSAVREYGEVEYARQYDASGYGTDVDGYGDASTSTDGGVTVCTMDARLCPDGSYVGRTGPRCEFVCPSVATSTRPIDPRASSTSPLLTGEVTGIVTTSPTCPVERVPADPACAPRPYMTTVVLTLRSSGKEVARTQTNSAGVYDFSVLPGSYTVSAAGGMMYPRCAPVDVAVTRATAVDADIACDSGIR